jgi:hypothetical protein
LYDVANVKFHREQPALIVRFLICNAVFNGILASVP